MRFGKGGVLVTTGGQEGLSSLHLGGIDKNWGYRGKILTPHKKLRTEPRTVLEPVLATDEGTKDGS